MLWGRFSLKSIEKGCASTAPWNGPDQEVPDRAFLALRCWGFLAPLPNLLKCTDTRWELPPELEEPIHMRFKVNVCLTY